MPIVVQIIDLFVFGMYQPIPFPVIFPTSMKIVYLTKATERISRNIVVKQN